MRESPPSTARRPSETLSAQFPDLLCLSQSRSPAAIATVSEQTSFSASRTSFFVILVMRSYTTSVKKAVYEECGRIGNILILDG